MAIFEKITDPNAKPENARIVSEDRIAGFYEVVVRTWKPQYEIWALAYGPQILGVAGALSGWYGNMYFRKKLRLKSYGFLTTYLPNTVLPFLAVHAFHSALIQKKIYTEPMACTICRETRAAAVQLGFGLIQPLVLVPASSLMFATRHFTQRIPSPIYNRRDFYKFLIQIYRPLKVPMSLNAIIQISLAAIITHFEEDQFFHIQREMNKPKLDEIEES